MRRLHAALPFIALAAVLPLLLPGSGFDAEAGSRPTASPAGSSMPWREAGLTESQAAAHLLDRFTYGPRPGEVEAVVAKGLGAWFEAQLAAAAPSPELDRRLRDLDALAMSDREIAKTFPNPGLVLIQAVNEGVVRREDVAAVRAARDSGETPTAEQQRARRDVLRWARDQGYRSQRDLAAQLTGQKLYRAVYSENQLEAVMTDLWFNHFNVSTTDNEARPYVLAYERDAIRPHALGSFRELLGATAKHPAMLLYLDNARSGAEGGMETTFAGARGGRAGSGGLHTGRGGFEAGGRGRFGGRLGVGGTASRPSPPPGLERPTGLNENYARELLELHTLGVDGGYDQHDVVEVARAFSGWSVVPPGPRGDQVFERLGSARRAGGMGFVVDGLFLFRADRHDAETKTVLGHTLRAGRGMEDGEEVLDLLTTQPATARHVAQKLATRFVADDPPAALVDRLAASYRSGGGDVKVMLRTLVASPEFWAARREKVKSPFELAASALRALDADVEQPRAVVEWVSRMGQPLYAYQAPTGYPDREEFWVNTGSLLNRMNFGLALAAGQIRGLAFDLAALAGGGEPESQSKALETYVPLLLPQRDVGATVTLLEPMVRDPHLAQRVAEASSPEPTTEALAETSDDLLFGRAEDRAPRRRAGLESPPSAVAQVVGVILGSPEFQRR
ncbi:MAG: DUF1800 domain-containing protein [Acidobacteria bacterium]|nr:DUF1800 domain-containing protein [Acidobacteriota bacterium]